MVFLAACCIRCKPSAKLAKKTPSDSLAQMKIQGAEVTAGNFSDQTVFHFDSTALSAFLTKYPGFSSYSEDLRKFYRARKYAYAWYDRHGLIEQAAGLFNRIQNLGQDGLKATLPYESSFRAMMDDTDTLLRREPMNAEAEMMLTSQYFSYAHRAWQGIAEEETRKLEWYLPRKKLELDELMDSLLHDGNRPFVAREPVYRQYALLKSYLQKYTDIEATGGWKPISADKKSYHKGDSADVILQVRKRLRRSGEFTGDTVSIHFTDEVETAVKSFQERRGLKTDGIIGAGVIREMNIPVSDLIEKIVINMERSRWVPVSLNGEYIVVNIPAFKLYVYRSDSLIWDMNIVAGQTIHKTVIFNGDLKYIVFSPYWNVPASIIENEVLPGIAQDSAYLQKHNMEMVGNTVRQKPGPGNSLGQVKFLFPNSYSIYLHDTPSKRLFNEDSRAFSHGCIRLGEPKKLATYLLRNNPEWPESKIAAAMNSGKEKYVTLKQPVPVFIAYFTAWVGRDGKVNFRQDVYNNDDRLAKMIFESGK